MLYIPIFYFYYNPGRYASMMVFGKEAALMITPLLFLVQSCAIPGNLRALG